MAPYPGFVGPANRSQSVAVADDQLVNLYPEKMGTGTGKSAAQYYRTPGTRTEYDLPTAPLRAQYTMDGNPAWAVAGGRLYQLESDGTFTDLGGVGSNGVAQIVGNGLQLLIRSGSNGYIYDINAQTLTQIPGWLDGVGASGICMIDGYFIASKAGTQQFFVSDLYDGATWDGLQFDAKSGAPDNIETIYADHRELWLLGTRTTEVWWNVGSNQPFQRIQGAFITTGIVANRSVCAFDNSMAWLGQDDRGFGIFWRPDGYTTKRISDFAIEYAISTYTRIDDAIAFSYQDRGHTFYVVSFPTANITWAYDAATQSWAQREYWDPIHGQTRAIRGRVYCFAFGKHLVGDYLTGRIYEMSATTLTDINEDGEETALRAYRIPPSLYSENKMLFLHRLEVIMQTGVVADTDPPLDPTMTLAISKDGGYTWGSERQAQIGKIGQYEKRVYWDMLGSGRRITPRLMVTDAVPVSIIDATVNLTVGRA